jgi:hypothetical protein
VYVPELALQGSKNRVALVYKVRANCADGTLTSAASTAQRRCSIQIMHAVSKLA